MRHAALLSLQTSRTIAHLVAYHVPRREHGVFIVVCRVDSSASTGFEPKIFWWWFPHHNTATRWVLSLILPAVSVRNSKPPAYREICRTFLRKLNLRAENAIFLNFYLLMVVVGVLTYQKHLTGIFWLYCVCSKNYQHYFHFSFYNMLLFWNILIHLYILIYFYNYYCRHNLKLLTMVHDRGVTEMQTCRFFVVVLFIIIIIIISWPITGWVSCPIRYWRHVLL